MIPNAEIIPGNGRHVIDDIRALCQHRVLVGIHPEAGIHPESGIHVAAVAAQHVYGNPSDKLPQRDFMRTTYSNFSSEVKQLTADTLKYICQRKNRVQLGLSKLGEAYTEKMQQNLVTGGWDSLSRITILRKTWKGSAFPTAPLRDTDTMLDSITYKVRRF